MLKSQQLSFPTIHFTNLPVPVFRSGVFAWSVPLLSSHSSSLGVLEVSFLDSSLSLGLDVVIEVRHEVGSLAFDISLPLVDGQLVGSDLLALFEVFLVSSGLLDLLGVFL